MDKKSKILLGVFVASIVLSVAFTYWRIVIKRDYIIEGQTDCDPTTETCFIWECDPESEEEGEACTGNPEEDIWYYKIVERKAANIPLCDPETDETCDPWTCAEEEEDCSETLCDETNKEQQEAECNDPVQYNLENPAEEEEAVECAEGDTECAADEDAVEGDANEGGDLTTDEGGQAGEESVEQQQDGALDNTGSAPAGASSIKDTGNLEVSL